MIIKRVNDEINEIRYLSKSTTEIRSHLALQEKTDVHPERF